MHAQPKPTLAGMTITDELTAAVASSASLSPAQASLAVAAVMRLLAARLPSPLFGELQLQLGAGQDKHDAASLIARPPAPEPAKRT